jgi:hypothetical protein
MKMTNSNKFDPHESFYHGLIKSKLWLCEELEIAMYNEFIKEPSLHILGCWDNLMAFMLLTRKPEFYNTVHGYDIDPEAINTANRVCDMWKYESPKVHNHIQDVNDYDFSKCDNSIFINCSIDQMDSNEWYDSVPDNSLVCIQTTNMVNPDFPWYIKQTTESLDALINKFNFTKLIYSGHKHIQFQKDGYKRFMIIGCK